MTVYVNHAETAEMAAKESLEVQFTEDPSEEI